MNNKHYVGKRISAFELYDNIGPITGVALLLDDENELLAGDDSGYMLEVSCPFGTQAIADDLLTALRGKTYQGFRGENAVLSPTAELGDGMTVNGIYSLLAHRTVNFGPGHMSEVEAPGESTMEHEFKWESPEQKEFKRKMAVTRSLIEKTSEQIALRITSEQAESLIKQRLDSIELSVSSANGSTTFKLTADGAELSTKTLNLSVNAVNVTGKLTASQIDATNLKVAAANITGKLTLDQMASISFSNLSDSAAIMNDINDAYAMAEDAEAAAADAADTVDAWRYNGGTYIDSSKIMVTTLMATELLGGEVALLTSAERQAGGLDITGSSTSTYAIELWSNGALRLSAGYGAVYLEDSDGAHLSLYGDATLQGSGGAYFEASDQAWVQGDFLPVYKARYNCGNANFYWAGVYTETCETVTSDRRAKKDIAYGRSAISEIFDDLRLCEFRLVDGTSGRLHSGFTAQDFEEALAKRGIDTADCAALVKGKDMNGNTVYGIRYGELIAPLVDEVQKLKSRMAQLEGRNA